MKKLLYFIITVVVLVVLAGLIKFNFINDDIYFQNKKGEYINAYGKKIEFLWYETDICDENGKRYKTAKEAQKAGLKTSEYGMTYCPEYKMDPSWDKNSDGINDCYDDNSCAKNIDYMQARKR